MAELHLDDAPHVFERFGRHPVAQQLELRDELFGEEPFATRHDLPELDVGRPEVRERDAEPAREVLSGVRRTLAAGADRPGAERAADPSDDAGEASERWQMTGSERAWHPGARRVTELVDV